MLLQYPFQAHKRFYWYSENCKLIILFVYSSYLYTNAELLDSFSDIAAPVEYCTASDSKIPRYKCLFYITLNMKSNFTNNVLLFWSMQFRQKKTYLSCIFKHMSLIRSVFLPKTFWNFSIWTLWHHPVEKKIVLKIFILKGSNN